MRNGPYIKQEIDVFFNHLVDVKVYITPQVRKSGDRRLDLT